MARFKLSQVPDSVRRLCREAFPEWKGRKVAVEVSDRAFSVASYWDGGSRDRFVVVEICSGRSFDLPEGCADPFNALSRAQYQPRVGSIVVEHSVFRGKDGGCTLHVHPDDVHRPVLSDVAGLLLAADVR